MVVLERLIGTLRLLACVPLLLFGTAYVLAVSPIRRRWHGASASQWGVVGMARVFGWIMAIRIRAPEGARIRAHRGLIVANHQSYLDVIALLSVGPVRFMAAEGVKKLPLVGWMANIAGTVYVNRGSEASRAAARARAADRLRNYPHPPLTVFPEGRISPDGRILPLRRGAFEMALESGVSVLPCVIVFRPREAVAWGQREWLLAAVLKMASRIRRLEVEVMALPVAAGEAASAERLAAQVQQALADSVGLGITFDDLPRS